MNMDKIDFDSVKVKLSDYKFEPDIELNDIKKLIDPVINKMDMSKSFSKDNLSKFLQPDVLKLLNDIIFPTQNFFKFNVLNNPVTIKKYLLLIDNIIFYILQNPKSLDPINKNKSDFSKIVKQMCILYLKKPSIVKKIKTFLEKAYNVPQIKTLQYVLDNTTKEEWITSKEFKQKKSQSNPPNKKRNEPPSNVDVGPNAIKQSGGADSSNETSSVPSTPIDSGVVASYMLGLGQDIDSSGPTYMSRTDATNELLSNAFASYDERTAIGDEILEIGAANADPTTVRQVNAALREFSQEIAMQYPDINLAQPLYERT